MTYVQTSYPASERCPELRPEPELQRKPEVKVKPHCSTMICRDAFDKRMASISELEGKVALRALLKLNCELMPHVSRAQEGMWIELSGVFIKKRGPMRG